MLRCWVIAAVTLLMLAACANPQRFKPTGSRDWCAEVGKLDNC
jgi:hypothetical protein